MQLPLALAVLGGLIAISAAVGLLLKAASGRVRVGAADSRPLVHPDQLGVGIAFGSSATLVQFSTEFCSGARRVLSEVSATTDGVAYLDVDVTNRADLVRRFSILQSARCR